MIEIHRYTWFRNPQLRLEGDYLVRDTGWKVEVPYDALGRDHSGLHHIFAEIDTTPAAVLAFAQEYGHLGVRTYSASNVNNWVEPLVLWYLEVRLMRAMLRLWDELSSKDTAKLEARVDQTTGPGSSSAKLVQVDLGIENPSDDIKKLMTLDEEGRVDFDRYQQLELFGRADDRELMRDPIVRPCLRALTQRLSSLVGAECEPAVVIDPDSRGPRLRVFPQNLRGAMWLRFADHVSGELEYRWCASCRKPYELSPSTMRRDALYCSDTCRSKAYRDRKRRAVEMAAEDQSAESIAKELGVDGSSVERWISPKGGKDA